MQFTLASIVAMLAMTAAAAPSPVTEKRATGQCGLDTYNNQFFCIIGGISFGCSSGTCQDRAGPSHPCSGGDGVYKCPK